MLAVVVFVKTPHLQFVGKVCPVHKRCRDGNRWLHIMYRAGKTVLKLNKRYNEEARNDAFMESSPEHDVARNVTGKMYNEHPELSSLDGLEEMRYLGANAGSGYRRSFAKKENCNNGEQG